MKKRYQIDRETSRSPIPQASRRIRAGTATAPAAQRSRRRPAAKRRRADAPGRPGADAAHHGQRSAPARWRALPAAPSRAALPLGPRARLPRRRWTEGPHSAAAGCAATTATNKSLGSYALFRRCEPLDDAVWDKLMLGLSTRNYSQAVREFAAAYGIEKSAVSEHFVAHQPRETARTFRAPSR